MIDILKPVGSGACWISVLNDDVEEDWVASVFLAAKFSSLALSSFISLLIIDMTGNSSLLLEVAYMRLASRCVHMSSP